MKIKTLIVEDEQEARNGLVQLLEQRSSIEIVATAKDGLRAIESIEEKGPDLLLLDIQLPNINGFEVLQSITQIPPAIVFITAFDQYAIQAFEVHAMDYLLKPFTDERFFQAIDRACQQLRQKHTIQLLNNKLIPKKEDGIIQDQRSSDIQRFVFRTDGKIIILPFDTILLIEADDYYIHIHSSRQKYMLRLSIKKMEDLLPTTHFVRVHRSTIVNLHHIESLDLREKYLVIKGGIKKDIGPSFLNKLLKLFPAQN